MFQDIVVLSWHWLSATQQRPLGSTDTGVRSAQACVSSPQEEMNRPSSSRFRPHGMSRDIRNRFKRVDFKVRGGRNGKPRRSCRGCDITPWPAYLCYRFLRLCDHTQWYSVPGACTQALRSYPDHHEPMAYIAAAAGSMLYNPPRC